MPKISVFIFIVFNVFVGQAQEKITVSAEDLIKLLNEKVQSEINLVRQNTESYRKMIFESCRLDSSRYEVQSGKIWFIEEQGKNFSSKVSTHEGIAAYQVADSFLANQQELKPYMYNKRLRFEARKHCEYLSRTGRFTHDRAGGKDMDYLDDLEDAVSRRIAEILALRRFRIFPGEYSKQNLDKEINEVAQEIVLGWIVDDGIWNRGHRDAIFDSGLNRFGAYCLVDEKGNVICAVEFSNQAFKSVRL